METGLRVVLLLVAMVIIAGIIWDTFRSRRKPALKKNRAYRVDRLDGQGIPRKELEVDEFDADTHFELSEIDEVVLVKTPGTQAKAKTQTQIQAPIDEDADLNWEEEEELEQPSPVSDKIFILNVMAKQPGVFLGKKLIQVLDEAHLFYGEMQIFHRYENTDGSGKLMFSLASAVEPGYFELSNLESLVTPGLTLFFSPSTRNQSIAAFELMLRTARILASALDGEIKDQNRRPLTLEAIEKYRENVRESVQLPRASASLANKARA